MRNKKKRRKAGMWASSVLEALHLTHKGNEKEINAWNLDAGDGARPALASFS